MCVGPFAPDSPEPVTLAPPPPSPGATPKPATTADPERSAARRRTRQQLAYAVNRADRFSAGPGGLGGTATTAQARLLGQTAAPQG